MRCYSKMGKIFDDLVEVEFSLPKTNVDMEDLIYRNDYNSFISAIGGGLGLFLGFSMLSFVHALFERLEDTAAATKPTTTRKESRPWSGLSSSQSLSEGNVKKVEVLDVGGSRLEVAEYSPSTEKGSKSNGE